MDKKSNKPYRNYSSKNNSNKYYSNNKKKNYNKNRNIKNYNRINSKEKDLEKTTRIRIDNERLNDAESLDTSFLEGRLEKKVKDNSKLKEKLIKEQRKVNFDISILKNIFFILGFICLIILIVLLCINSNYFKNNNDNKSSDDNVEVNDTEVIDDNYLFVGDFYTDEFDFNDLDYHYVKVSDEKLTTSNLLESMNEKIYVYNPSKVFIQVGINDLIDGEKIDTIVENISKIIDDINENRPYAEIYIESLYPINSDMEDYDLDSDITNSDIVKVNNKLRTLTTDKNVNYVNVYNLLIKDDKLNEDYTSNGVNLNSKAYTAIFKEIEKRVG